MKKVIRVFVLVMLSMIGVNNVNAEALLDGQASNYWSRFLPMRSIRTTITVTDHVVNTVIEQTFENEMTDSVDATYYYPVPENASVTGFGQYFGDYLHYYPLEPGEQGSSGGGGGNGDTELGQFLGSNGFGIPLERLAPGNLNIRFEFSEMMDYSFGVYDFMYPLGLPNFSLQAIDTVEIDLYLTSQRAIEYFQMSNYDADILYQDSDSLHAVIAGNNFNCFDDLEVEIVVSQEDVGMWVLPCFDDMEETGHFLAVLEPGNVLPGEILRKTFTFVMDVSGSMNGNRIQQAKEAAIYCVENLNEDDYFNIIPFNNYSTPWRENAVPATQANINAAVNYINTRHARGSTNLYGAVMDALNQEIGAGTTSQILLLSDGYPTSGVSTHLPTIVSAIDENNTINASIFTVAIGSEDDNLDFMRLIATENNGLSISPDPNLVDLSDIISVFFDQFSTPVLTNITFDYGDAVIDEVYPPQPYTIFAGMQTIIAGKYVGAPNTTIDINASVAVYDTTITYGPFDFGMDDGNGFVPRMWAIKKIDYWLAWMAVYGEDDEIIEMIVELSMQYGILTPYTDYNTDPPNPVSDSFNLHVYVETCGVRITWSPDQIPYDARFDIFRKTKGENRWEKLNERAITDLIFMDYTAEKGVGYTYKVVMSGDDFIPLWAEIVVEGHEANLFNIKSIAPNPFNEQSVMTFRLKEASIVQIEVYDILGRKVTELMQGSLSAGQHVVNIDGHLMTSGTYFVRTQVASKMNGTVANSIEKVTLLK